MTTRLMLAALVLLGTVALAPAGAPADTEADKEALRRIARTFEAAIRERDLARFQAELAPDFAGTLVTNENVDRASITKFWDWVWELIGAGGQWTSEVVPEPTRFYGDLAVARGVTNDRIVTDRGREYRYAWNWTAVLQKQGDAWKIVAAHGSLDPLGNPFVRVEQFWAKVIYGAGGGLAGFVLGGAVTFVVARRRRGAGAR